MMNNIEIFSFIVPAIASIFTIFWRSSFKNFLFLYCIAVALVAFLDYSYIGIKESFFVMGIGFLGFLITIFGFMGFLGKRVSIFVYKNILVALGLFPWFVSWKASLLFLFSVIVYSLSDFIYKSNMIAQLSFVRVVAKGKERDLEDEYMSYLPIPIVIGSICSIVMLLFFEIV